jgi:hypothetical protein
MFTHPEAKAIPGSVARTAIKKSTAKFLKAFFIHPASQARFVTYYIFLSFIEQTADIPLKIEQGECPSPYFSKIAPAPDIPPMDYMSFTGIF